MAQYQHSAWVKDKPNLLCLINAYSPIVVFFTRRIPENNGVI